MNLFWFTPKERRKKLLKLMIDMLQEFFKRFRKIRSFKGSSEGGGPQSAKRVVAQASQKYI